MLRCYTKEAGLQGYMINSLKSKKAIIKPSMLLPLTQLHLVASKKGKGSLERIKEAKVLASYTSLPFNPIKNAVGLFLAEVLYRTLKEEQSNPAKFEFIQTTCQLLDEVEPLPAHFHLSFMVAFSRYLGFYPELSSASTGRYFDKLEGVFLTQQPLHPHYLNAETSQALKGLLSIKMTDEKAPLTKPVRKALLAEMLEYYRLHVDGFGKLKSVDVLEELFS